MNYYGNCTNCGKELDDFKITKQKKDYCFNCIQVGIKNNKVCIVGIKA